MMLLNIDRLPIWVVHLNKMAWLGHGDVYKETQTRMFVTITPTPAEQTQFPYLDGVEEVYLVYDRRSK